jgi:hypothetical protein
VTNPHSYNANELMNLAGAVEQAPYIKLIHATFDGELSKEAQQMIVTALRALASPSSSGPEEHYPFLAIGFINNDGGITWESGREPRQEQGGKLIYIAVSCGATHSEESK